MGLKDLARAHHFSESALKHCVKLPCGACFGKRAGFMKPVGNQTWASRLWLGCLTFPIQPTSLLFGFQLGPWPGG